MRVRCAAICFSIGVLVATSAHAQTTTTARPPTQDAQLRSLLALGDALGCAKLLRLTTTDQGVVAEALKTAQITKELRAICGPSAVSSASSLSGGINTVQATKSTSTFRPKPRPKSKRPSARRTDENGMFDWRDTGAAVFQFGGDQEVGAAVFGGIQLDRLTRAQTDYESGYKSTLTGFTGGADYRWGNTVAGGFLGRTQATGDFTQFSALLTGAAGPTDAAFLASPTNLAAICGVSTGGDFDDRTTHLGGFVVSGVGTSGFVQGSAGWSRLNHDYSRNVCAIEANAGLKLGLVNGRTALLDSNGNQLDDIFAGTISGLRTVNETNFSFGGGAELGNETVSFTPHAEFTVRRASAGAYVETGRSTVMGIEGPTGTGRVTDNQNNTVLLTIGGPTGLELAFDATTRTSVVLESGGVVAFRVGRAVPYAGGFWRREFKDQIPVVSARMAGDLRTNPVTFTFGSDAFDRDSLLFKFGCTVTGERGGFRVEWSTNQRDVLFTARSFSAHAVFVF